MRTEFIDYQLGNLTMQGFIASPPEANDQAQPLVLIVHDWRGPVEFSQEKAKYFAKQGFVGFAVDLYGKGKRGSDTDKSINQQLFSELMHDRTVIVPRLQAALDCALKLQNIDRKKVMVLGFCMGGLCALDLARSGMDVAGVVSVHGVLNPPNISSNAQIKAKILVLHGHLDKMGDVSVVQAFEEEMQKRKADWQMHVFGDTYHAFTNPKAHDIESGLIYSESANTRTWGLVRVFTDEILS